VSELKVLVDPDITPWKVGIYYDDEYMYAITACCKAKLETVSHDQRQICSKCRATTNVSGVYINKKAWDKIKYEENFKHLITIWLGYRHEDLEVTIDRDD
jgi:hypothetical protein